mmetsp:Transcript_6935/g.22984  ORF Transcript_6935/g.22984 Transcript_6935/m.22984 type:complete len:276 (+) Transcript_6935:1954-2781(+)
MSTDSFILAIPNLVMPKTSPLYVITSANNIECRESMDMPWAFIVSLISLITQERAASIPKDLSASMMWFVVVSSPTTPSIDMTSRRFVPSTIKLNESLSSFELMPPLLITARVTEDKPRTMTFGTAVRNDCKTLIMALLPVGCFEDAFSSGGITCIARFPARTTLWSFSFNFGAANMASLADSAVTSNCSEAIAFSSSTNSRYAPDGRKTTEIVSQISPSIVFSIRPFTNRAAFTSLSEINLAVMIGVEIFFVALIISLIRGTPNVMFIDATPAK